MPSERVIRVIPQSALLPGLEEPKRVCAYVRVSTHHTAQMDSLQNQTEYYERKIKGTPGYEYRGIYSDSGIPGSKEKRPGFQAMMVAARKGEIDIILTKAVSRFARNTVMLLKAVREIKGLGVPGNIRVMCDQHDGVALLVKMIEHLHDFRACLAVQVACGLVSQDQLGFGGQRPGNGDALLLPARQLLGRCFMRSFSPTSSSASCACACRWRRPICW